MEVINDARYNRWSHTPAVVVCCCAVSAVGELESLFYTLSFWVCEGHLPWRNAVTTELALSMKWMAMTLRFEVRREPGRCIPSPAPLLGVLSTVACCPLCRTC